MASRGPIPGLTEEQETKLEIAKDDLGEAKKYFRQMKRSCKKYEGKYYIKTDNPDFEQFCKSFIKYKNAVGTLIDIGGYTKKEITDKYSNYGFLDNNLEKIQIGPGEYISPTFQKDIIPTKPKKTHTNQKPKKEKKLRTHDLENIDLKLYILEDPPNYTLPFEIKKRIKNINSKWEINLNLYLKYLTSESNSIFHCATICYFYIDKIFGIGTSQRLGLSGRSTWNMDVSSYWEDAPIIVADKDSELFNKYKNENYKNVPLGAIIRMTYSKTKYKKEAKGGPTHNALSLGNGQIIQEIGRDRISILDFSNFIEQNKEYFEVYDIILPKKELIIPFEKGIFENKTIISIEDGKSVVNYNNRHKLLRKLVQEKIKNEPQNKNKSKEDV